METPGIDISRIFRLIYSWFSNADIVVRPEYYLSLWKLLSILVSLVLLAIIFLIFIKLFRLVREEKLYYTPSVELLEKKEEGNAEWERVMKYARSGNPSEWKLAIIEADNMLDNMLRAMGYQGETLGERLKAIDPADFDTLQDAWDAHKLRNQIAHQSGFILTEREVRIVLDKYERVFREFSYL